MFSVQFKITSIARTRLKSLHWLSRGNPGSIAPSGLRGPHNRGPCCAERLHPLGQLMWLFPVAEMQANKVPVMNPFMPIVAFNICCPRDCVSEGFKGGTRGAPIMSRDAVSRTANVERNGGHKWVPHGTETRKCLGRQCAWPFSFWPSGSKSAVNSTPIRPRQT